MIITASGRTVTRLLKAKTQAAALGEAKLSVANVIREWKGAGAIEYRYIVERWDVLVAHSTVSKVLTGRSPARHSP